VGNAARVWVGVGVGGGDGCGRRRGEKGGGRRRAVRLHRRRVGKRRYRREVPLAAGFPHSGSLPPMETRVVDVSNCSDSRICNV
jgi:hypothetical protein